MKENSVVHVRLDEPLHIRRKMLEAAIETVEVLKTMDRVLDLQQQKLRYWEKLKTAVNKIRTMNNQLVGNLPHVALPRPKKQPEPKQIKIIKPSELREFNPKPVSVKKEHPLSRELDDIRRKLDNLKI